MPPLRTALISVFQDGYIVAPNASDEDERAR